MLLKRFIQKLLLPKNGIYILLGIVIMFFTFFTTNNAMEIAISGVASIFIGIGVNNFTQAETHEKDKAQQQLATNLAIKILQHAQNKAANTATLLGENISPATAQQQLTELKDYLELSIEEIKSMQ